MGKTYMMELAGKWYRGFLLDGDDDAGHGNWFDYAIAEISTADIAVVDLETTGLSPFLGDRLAGVAVYLPSTSEAFYFSFRHAEGGNLGIGWMDDLWDSLCVVDTLIGWNFKFDLNFMAVDKYDTLNPDQAKRDAMIALHLLDENRYDKGLNYKLKDTAAQLIDENAKNADDVLHEELRKRGIKKGLMYQLPAELVAEYAMMDVVLTWELEQLFAPYLEKWEQAELYEELSEFEWAVLHRMELRGMQVDRDLIERMIEENGDEASLLLAKIQQAAGYAINPNSPAQVASWLKLDNAQRETLELSGDPRAEMLLDYKFTTKAVNTFYTPYLHFSSGDGSVHPSLHVIGTVSGRLSSSEPNLQQVPRKAKPGVRGYSVKDVFTAPEGYVLAQFDYSQLELRLACHFAHEAVMTNMFNTGIDMHQYTADALNIDRYTGKTMNFGLLYGMGAEKAAKFLRLDLKEARELVPAWHALYPAFRAAHNEAIRIAQLYRTPSGELAEGPDDRGYQYIRLPDGRVRHYYGEDARYFSSWNTLIQGTGAIVMRRALLDICKTYPPEQDMVIPVMTVHDSLIAYIREWAVEEASQRIIGIMTAFPEFNPPMAVEAKWGKSWGTV